MTVQDRIAPQVAVQADRYGNFQRQADPRDLAPTSAGIDHFRYFAGVIRAQEGASARSTTTPSPITSTSPSASSARSSRGTSRC